MQIGLMRDGTLLAEDSPSQLMAQYNSSTLEEVFLQLCQRQHASSNGRRLDEWASLARNTQSLPIVQNFTIFCSNIRPRQFIQCRKVKQKCL